MESRLSTSWYRLQLSAAEQAAVLEYRDYHDDPVVRTKMNVLWTVHLGYTRTQAAQLAQVGEATAKRYIRAYRDGGLDALLSRKPGTPPVSELAAYAELVKKALTEQPVRTTAEAAERIFELTGLRRGLTQTRKFLASLGFTWQRTRAVPVPPKSR